MCDISRALKVKPRASLQVYNTVFTVKFVDANGQRRVFDLEKTAELMHGRYKRKGFPAASFRHLYPFFTFSLFRKGKGVFTGLNCQEEAVLASIIFATELGIRTNQEIRVQDFKCENIVGSLALGHSVNLETLHRSLQMSTRLTHEYVPDTFPGLQMWIPVQQSEVVVIVFDSGALVIAGAKTYEQLHKAAQTAQTYISRSRTSH
jgi:TATA-box binding protein (TBP) (component of TFIID and TFIIIB)